MALIILNPGETAGTYGEFSSDQVFGTTSGETVVVDGDGVVEFDPSFNQGGDTIRILGNAGDYSITRNGSNVVFTNSTGAMITIPYGDQGIDIEFADAASRTLVFSDGSLMFGEQMVVGTDPIDVDPGTPVNTAPEFGDDSVTITLDNDQVFSDTLFGTAVDAEDDDLVYSLDTGALNGTVVVNADGSYTYTPNAGFVGNDSYVVLVTDEGGLTDTLTVNVVVSAPGSMTGDTFRLTNGTDDITGTSGDDVFSARVSQNMLGAQANQLGSGDFIDGGAGDDRLDAWVQDASPLGAGPSSSILPETVDVETAHFRALSVAQTIDSIDLGDLPTLFGDGEGPRSGVEINASDMLGLEEVGSVRSDDSLTIYNLTTLDNDGVTARETSEITVRMDHTGNNNSLDLESDLTVLFDRDYLICPPATTTGGQISFEVLDLDAALLLDAGLTVYPAGRSNAGETIQGRLDDVPYTALSFDVTLASGLSTTITVELYIDSDGNPINLQDLTPAEIEAIDYDSFAALLARVNNGLEAAGYGDQLRATFGPDFTATDTDTNPGGSADGRTIVIENIADGSPITDPNVVDLNGATLIGQSLEFRADRPGVPGEKDFHLEFSDVAPTDVPCILEVDIVLDKVGRGGAGGELTVGGMVPNLGNVYDDEADLQNGELPRGLDQFNITVEGTDDEDSSLAALRSTDNTLRTINITNADGSEADLTIGNRNTDDTDGFFASSSRYLELEFNETVPNGTRSISHIDLGSDGVSSLKNNAVKDVLTINATAFDNDVELHAFFSDEVVDKYLDDRVDAGGMMVEPDGDAVWMFGAGDDTINVNISNVNFAQDGAATRDGFSFTTFTGAGDDAVLIQISEGENSFGEFNPAAPNWYTNHLINENLDIYTEDGDDFVWTFGSTAAYINTGDGADTIYTDNSGYSQSDSVYNDGRATWVFNSQNDDVDNLLSYGAASISNAVNLTVTIQYMDFVVTSNVGNTVGSVNGETVTDLDIVNAIMNGINGHPVLSDFLVAEMGPSRTLVVRSLVDGTVVDSDLTVALGASSTALTTAQVNNGANTFTFGELSAAQLAALGFATDGTAAGGRFDADLGFDSSFGTLDGIDSGNVNNNFVEGGAGNDEIALSSNGQSTETLVISGVFSSLTEPGSGDHVLNFDVIGEEEIAVDGTPEEQTLTFTGDATDDFNVVVTLGDGTVVTVPITSGALEADIASDVADAIDAEDGVSATSTDGVVTIVYDDNGDVDEVTAAIVSDTPNEEQTVTLSGVQEAAAAITLDFAGETFSINVPAFTSAAQIEQLLLQEIAANSDGTIVGSADGSFDGSFGLDYFGDGPNPGPATVTVTPVPGSTGGNITVAPTTTETDFTAFDPTTTVVADTTVEGTDDVAVALGLDIIDLSAIIGVGGPDYFTNDAQVDDIEFASIDALVSSGDNGVILIDQVQAGDPNAGSGATELARIQSMVTAADDTAQTGTNTSVIITVSSAPGVGESPADGDGTFGDFYQVVDGAAAGDATVTYLGRLYLGSSDGDTSIGNFDAMTEANFTPLSPEELMLTYNGGMIV